jgi:hypothetical protein
MSPKFNLKIQSEPHPDGLVYYFRGLSPWVSSKFSLRAFVTFAYLVHLYICEQVGEPVLVHVRGATVSEVARPDKNWNHDICTSQFMATEISPAAGGELILDERKMV